MYMFHALERATAGNRTAGPSATEPGTDRSGERGSAVVEWLGISALSIGMLVGIFAALEQVGLGVIEAIRGSLGV